MTCTIARIAVKAMKWMERNMITAQTAGKP